MRRFRRFFQKTSDQRWILTEAVLFLFAAKILLIFLPVKTVMKVSLTSDGRMTEPDLNLLKDIKWALRHANRLSLWKNRCLVQSIAGRWMLQRRGI
ncbi:MAG: lasso peptide biosynthesis B2 protein, partial [Bacteroidales bacterium]|nr:lasso peptide biosynthesis B2 protein [Bacteroidales bacterium]